MEYDGVVGVSRKFREANIFILLPSGEALLVGAGSRISLRCSIRRERMLIIEAVSNIKY